MTISYSGSFFKLLLRWKGSLYKAVWLELLIFLIIYYIIALVYNFILPKEHKATFGDISKLFDGYTKDIPITFLLGFYVTAVVKRWWEQFQFVAWPDDILSYVVVLIPGSEPAAVKKRRRIARWLNLTAALAWRDISVAVRRRFPTLDHIVSAGLMTPSEKKIQEELPTATLKWSIPILWISKIMLRDINSAQVGGSPPMLAHFFRELNVYRNCFKSLYCYDWVCIPLVYTQVAALATYGFFTLCLVGRQFLDNEINLYFPIFTVLQFTFYVGWFKVGQYLMRPFEEDDDDLELNYMLDRHIQTSYALVNTTLSIFQVGQYLMRPFEEDDDDLELNYMLDRHIQTSYALVNQVAAMDPPPEEDIDPILRNESTVPLVPYTRMAAKKAQHPPKLHAHVSYNEKDLEVVERLLEQKPGKKSRIREF